MVITAVHTDTVQDPEHLATCLAALSTDRQQRAMRLARPADRRLSVCAGLALDACLRTLGLREQSTVVRRGEKGCPLLREYPQWRISLSHSGEWAVCVLDNAAVGIDVERCRPLSVLPLARRYFSAGEAAWLESLPEEERAPSFLRLWTAKESCLKAQGLGLSALRSISVVPGFPLTGPSPWQWREYPLEGYQLTVCGTSMFSEAVQTIFSYSSDLLH